MKFPLMDLNINNIRITYYLSLYFFKLKHQRSRNAKMKVVETTRLQLLRLVCSSFALTSTVFN